MTAEPVLPPVPCTPWCKDGHGHTDAGHSDDQWCHSPQFAVALSTEDPDKDEDGTVWLPTAAVVVYRDSPKVPSHVQLEVPKTLLRFTSNEADDLADMLKHAAWLARQAGPAQ